MSKIHISTGNGQASQYDESQVRTMLQQGILKDDTLFWKEGMDGWHPLRELLPPPLTVERVSPPIPQQSSTPHYTFIKNPFKLTQVLKIMLWVSLGGTVISIVSNLWEMSLLNSSDIDTVTVEVNYIRQQFVDLLLLGVYIATTIIYAMWIYRANLNCHGFGSKDMKFTPGWAVGCWLIADVAFFVFYFLLPLTGWKFRLLSFFCFNTLYLSYKVMKEIWKVSSNPQNWQSEKGYALLRWCFVFEIISSAASVAGANTNDPRVGTGVSIISSIVDLPLTLVTIALVSQIMEKQAKLTGSNV